MQHRLQKIILLLLAVSPWCYGQASAMNGEISGTVTDPAGAAIANAAVSVTNRGTGFRQTGTTGDSGLYRFNLLPLGTYDLEVQAPGFAPGKRSGIEVNAGATVTVNLPMQIAGSTTQVEVTASWYTHRSGQDGPWNHARQQRDWQFAPGLAKPLQLHPLTA